MAHKRRVGVVGFGRMGKQIPDLFPSRNYEKVVSDTDPKSVEGSPFPVMGAIELAKISDILALCVPQDQTPKVVEEIGPYVNPNATVFYIDSNQRMATPSLLDNLPPSVKIAGIHPPFCWRSSFPRKSRGIYSFKTRKF